MSVVYVIEAIQGTKLKKLERYLSKQDPYVVFENVKAGVFRKTDTHWDSSSEPVSAMAITNERVAFSRKSIKEFKFQLNFWI